MPLLRSLVILAFLPSLLPAQDLRSTVLRLRYDVTSTSYVYGAFLGANGSTFGAPISPSGNNRCKTSGSSTTVTEETASTDPFAPVSVGDILQVTIPATGVRTSVVVTAKASAASITVEPAVDLTAGSAFTYLRTSVGTGDTLGWIPVSGDGEKSFSWTIATINATSIQATIQCVDSYIGAPYVTIYPPVTSETDTCFTGSFTAVKTCKFFFVDPYAACRLGFKVTGDAGAQSITAGYTGRRISN